MGEWLWSELFLGHEEPCPVPVRAAPSSHADALGDLALRFPASVQRKLAQTESERFLTISGGISGAVAETTIASPISAGATSIALADVSGISVGDLCVINPGGSTTENVVVKTVTPSRRLAASDDGRRLATPGVITVDPPTKDGYSSGTDIAFFEPPKTTSTTMTTTTTSGGPECFPGESMAVAPDQQSVHLASMQVQDSALVALADGLGFEPVYGFLHTVEDAYPEASWRSASMTARSSAAP